MKKLCLALFFLVFCSVTIAQNKTFSIADSLKNELAKAKQDTTKVLLLEKLTGFYALKNTTLALRYGREAWNLADSLQFDRGKILSAISSGRIMASNSDYTEALNKLLEARYLCEKNNNSKELFEVYLNLSLLYTNQKQFSDARSYIQKAKELHQKKYFLPNEIPLNLTMGRIYRAMDQFDSSLIYTQKSYETAQKHNYLKELPAITFYLGDIFWKLNQRDSSLKYYHKSLSYRDSINEGRVFSGLAAIFKQTNQVDSAIFYAKKALEHSHHYKYFTTAINSAQILSKLYENQGNLKNALYYYKISLADKDSLITKEKIRQVERLAFDEKQRDLMMMKKMAFHQEEAAKTIKIYALLGLLLLALIIAFFLYRNNQVKHKANHLLHKQKEEVDKQRHTAEVALAELKVTQNQLIQSEKLASLGELTAGIAHEIQNPLNFVNNFSELSVDLAKELKEEIEKPEIDKELIIDLANDLSENQLKINHHGKRASSIVTGMLQHSQTSAGVKELTDINKLADESLRLSYQALRAKDKNFNCKIEIHFDENIPKIEVISQDISRVLINLFNNAFYAINVAKKSYPSLMISTQLIDNQVVIRIKDNGTGMPDATKAKIFQPFFTTKPTGQGTGLGLSLSYDIITKGHGGIIEVETKEKEGSEFIIKLPL